MYPIDYRSTKAYPVIEEPLYTNCIFAMVLDERKFLKKNQKGYKCTHGKVLSWATARRVLGLPFEKEGEK